MGLFGKRQMRCRVSGRRREPGAEAKVRDPGTRLKKMHRAEEDAFVAKKYQEYQIPRHS